MLAALPDPPSYSAVRALLRILEEKGHATHRREGARYVYLPRASQEAASKSALKRVVPTFSKAPSRSDGRLARKCGHRHLRRGMNKLQQVIKQARKEGR